MENDHYQTLNVSEAASQQEIKQAYRQLAKQLHPDSQHVTADHEEITRLNAAYEILGDPDRRSRYDRERRAQRAGFRDEQAIHERAQRAAYSQVQYRHRRQAAQAADDDLKVWLQQVYNPVDRFIAKIINPLKGQLRALSADPFDDELMEDFQRYLEACRDCLEKAQGRFQSMPNPANAAAVAANLYHCLHQLEDGIEEMERFTYCYEESYLHTGQELFRISSQLRREAKGQMKQVTSTG